MKITVTLDNGTVLTGEVSESPAASKDFGPLAPAVPGPSMDLPRVGYPFDVGVTALPMPVKAGSIYSLEAIATGGVGSVTVLRGDGSTLKQDITGGFCPAFPAQALADETWSVTVSCSHAGEIRYIV